MNTAEWRERSLRLLRDVKAPIPPGVPANMAREFLQGRDKAALKEALYLVASVGKFLSGRCLRCLTPINVDGECYTCQVLSMLTDCGKALEEAAAGVHTPMVQRTKATQALNELTLRAQSFLSSQRERAQREGLINADGAPQVPVEQTQTEADVPPEPEQPKMILTD